MLMAASATHFNVAQAQDSNAVVIKDFMFSPMSMTVKAGTTVTFTNVGDLPHDATALKQSEWSTGTLAKGESKTVTLVTVGSSVVGVP